MILGVAGDLLSADEQRSHYLTKVGGAPWVPTTHCGMEPTGCNWSQSTICKACGRGLSLVFQAYAPLDADASGAHIERVLLVLGCTQPDCGRDARSWRAFRCQRAALLAMATEGDSTLHAESEPVCKGLESSPPGPAPATHQCGGAQGEPASSDPFGGGFDCGDSFDVQAGAPGAGGGAGSAALDFSDLGAVLEDCAAKQLQQQPALRNAKCGKGGAAVEGYLAHHAVTSAGAAAAVECIGASDGDVCTTSLELRLSGPPLPEFHIIGIEEPTGQTGTVDDSHVQRLLEEYERQEHMVGQGTPPHRPTDTNGGGTSSAPGPHHRPLGLGPGGRKSAFSTTGDSDEEGDLHAASDDSGSWAGEEYEEDHVRGVQRAYLKFAARLNRKPDQCARYSRGGQVLWPLQQLPQPAPCPSCGAPRTFEMQLMAPLLAVVLECSDWLQGPELERHGPAINAAANWDFATMAVYTCSANCQPGEEALKRNALGSQSHGSGGQEVAVLVEEYIEAVSEAQCHVPEELKVGA